ncbi:ABC transporter ATP-binding protein [Streptomyces scopuliridis]|uniref:ABC transporter ATP-binding protein n=1 Tax=Streptomyces scopuliridis TaxID=452529 RepID=UPI0036C70CCE
MSDHAVSVRSVSKSFDGKRVLEDIELSIEAGEFFSLLGPSGCGKTTALRIVAGLEQPDRGRILINGSDVTRTPPHRRPTNLVFQQGALFPHMNVFANVAYGLRARRVNRTEINRRVEEILDVVGMGEFAGRAPTTLSGGQRQRVAIARALVQRPDVLLLDEPLSALDLGLQLRMRRELRGLQRRTGTTFVCVTHNQGEAMEVSDRIAVMNDGRVEQVGTAEELYRAPAGRFVAEFLGENNLFETSPVPGSPGLVRADGLTLAVPGAGAGAEGGGNRGAGNGGTGSGSVRSGSTLVAVRPEAVRVVDPSDAASAGPAVVRSVGFLGARLRFVLETSTGREILADADGHTAAVPAGTSVGVAVHPAHITVVPGPRRQTEEAAG